MLLALRLFEYVSQKLLNVVQICYNTSPANPLQDFMTFAKLVPLFKFRDPVTLTPTLPVESKYPPLLDTSNDSIWFVQ